MEHPLLVAMTHRIPEIDSACIVPSQSGLALDQVVDLVQKARYSPTGRDYISSLERKVTHWDGTPNGIEILVLLGVDTHRLKEKQREEIQSNLDNLASEMDGVVEEIKRGGKLTQKDALLRHPKFDKLAEEFRSLPVFRSSLWLLKKALVACVVLVIAACIFSFVGGRGASQGTAMSGLAPWTISFLECMESFLKVETGPAERDMLNEIDKVLAAAKKTEKAEKENESRWWYLGGKNEMTPQVGSNISSGSNKREDSVAYPKLAHRFFIDLEVKNLGQRIEEKRPADSDRGLRPWAFVTISEFDKISRGWFDDKPQNCSQGQRVLEIRKAFYELARRILLLQKEAEKSGKSLSLVLGESVGKFRILSACRTLAQNAAFGRVEGIIGNSPSLPFFGDRDNEILHYVLSFVRSDELTGIAGTELQGDFLAVLRDFSRITEEKIDKERTLAERAAKGRNEVLQTITNLYAHFSRVVRQSGDLVKAFQGISKGPSGEGK